MRVYNGSAGTGLDSELTGLLTSMRDARGFAAVAYVQAKSESLNAYMRTFGLSACVVGVSGGIDSAVVLGLVAHAAQQPGSPIRKIVPLFLPVYDDPGATGQEEALARADAVCRQFDLDMAVVDLSGPHAALRIEVEHALGIAGEGWASGQVVSYARTPALYYATSLLVQAGHGPIVIGTTNRDEGAYLGYFGKASDGMVDVQLISDAHKSEVRATAVHLGVPQVVVDAVPTGDMFDGRVDEEVFGAPYDFVELYLTWMTLPAAEQARLRAAWPATTAALFDELAGHLENLHTYNGHKYLGRSPAVHLDVLPAEVPGGWQYGTWAPDGLLTHEQWQAELAVIAREDEDTLRFVPRTPRATVAPDDRPDVPRVDTSLFVGHFALADQVRAALVAAPATRAGATWARHVDDSCGVIHDLLTPSQAAALVADLQTQAWVPVGRNGMKGDFDPDRDPVGSWRASTYDPQVAAALWARLEPALTRWHTQSGVRWQEQAGWRPVAVNPLLRFIRYDDGGLLVPHYDAPFVTDADTRTMLSLVLYLSTDPGVGGGATRFLVDPQDQLPAPVRDYADWPAYVEDPPVQGAFRLPAGDALVFGHRLLHDGERVVGGRKLLLRTDITFTRA